MRRFMSTTFDTLYYPFEQFTSCFLFNVEKSYDRVSTTTALGISTTTTLGVSTTTVPNYLKGKEGSVCEDVC
jgi:hypothetical protein